MKEKIDKGVSLIEEKLKKSDKKLLYLALSGSHIWGLARPNSDIDFRGIYQDSTEKILALHNGKDTVEFSEGEYDVQLYEVGKFLRMLCNHNGNMVNLLWTDPVRCVLPIQFVLFPWVGLAHKFLTKELRFYYRGYAEGQRKRAMSQRGGKALIYTYREMFCGLFTLHYGVVEHDFMKLWDTAKENGWYKGDLLAKYFHDPTQEVSDEGWHRFYTEWEELCDALDKEAEKSLLPDTYDGYDFCNKLLLLMRLNGFRKEMGDERDCDSL